ncbi:MAG: glutamate mutase subunit S [uncultured archaeon A07HR60]|jgi:methylaspartate mutase sigma subunit|nr:MAG: glutamate mutase subunit S [uncultured archaeon A07HR60]
MSTRSEQTPGPVVVLGTIGSDAHVVGITLLEHALEDAGFEVHNLGAQTSCAEFAEAAAATGADGVLISSLYGHAEQDCRGLHDRLEQTGNEYVTCIGGNLSVGQAELSEVQQTFREMGFDRVFGQNAEFDTVIETLRDAIAGEKPARDRESDPVSVRT